MSNEFRGPVDQAKKEKKEKVKWVLEKVLTKDQRIRSGGIEG